jgi:hypothetical protein
MGSSEACVEKDMILAITLCALAGTSVYFGLLRQPLMKAGII